MRASYLTTLAAVMGITLMATGCTDRIKTAGFGSDGKDNSYRTEIPDAASYVKTVNEDDETWFVDRSDFDPAVYTAKGYLVTRDAQGRTMYVQPLKSDDQALDKTFFNGRGRE